MRDDPLRHAPSVGDPYVLGLWHKDRAHHQGFVNALRVLARRPRRPASARKFLIFGRARSGTTLLVRLLNQIRAIRCDGEVLHYAVPFPRAHLRRLAAAAEAEVYGCKLLSYQLLEVQKIRDPDAFFDGLAADGFDLVHIRRDTFRQSLSLSVAQASRRYHLAVAERGEKAPVELDPDLFIKQVRHNAALLDFETELMARRPHLVIDYEADLENPARHQETVDRLCRSFGAPSGPVAAPLKKTIDDGGASMIRNLTEIERRLRAEGYGDLLAPPSASRSG